VRCGSATPDGKMPTTELLVVIRSDPHPDPHKNARRWQAGDVLAANRVWPHEERVHPDYRVFRFPVDPFESLVLLTAELVRYRFNRFGRNRGWALRITEPCFAAALADNKREVDVWNIDVSTDEFRSLIFEKPALEDPSVFAPTLQLIGVCNGTETRSGRASAG